MAEEPRVYAVERDAMGRVRLTRREFVAAGATVAAVTVAGCSEDGEPRALGAGTMEPASVEASGECRAIPAHLEGVTALAFTADGSRLASGSADEDIKLWAIPDGAWLTTFTGHSAQVNGLALAPDATWLASADDHGVVRVWSLSDGAELASREDHGGAVHTLAAAPDGTWLASAGSDARVVLLAPPDFERWEAQRPGDGGRPGRLLARIRRLRQRHQDVGDAGVRGASGHPRDRDERQRTGGGRGRIMVGCERSGFGCRPDPGGPRR